MQYQSVYSFIIDKLQKELPSYLTYHSVQHTTDVVDAIQHIGQAEKIPDEDLILLKTAGLFHDTGFLKGYDKHETSSCSIAEKYCLHIVMTKNKLKKFATLYL